MRVPCLPERVFCLVSVSVGCCSFPCLLGCDVCQVSFVHDRVGHFCVRAQRKVSEHLTDFAWNRIRPPVACLIHCGSHGAKVTHVVRPSWQPHSVGLFRVVDGCDGYPQTVAQVFPCQPDHGSEACVSEPGGCLVRRPCWGQQPYCGRVVRSQLRVCYQISPVVVEPVVLQHPLQLPCCLPGR